MSGIIHLLDVIVFGQIFDGFVSVLVFNPSYFIPINTSFDTKNETKNSDRCRQQYY
jgi:hypothetical protein